MHGGDDEVEALQQVVLVVEAAVGADLQLAAVEQAEAAGLAPAGSVPAASSAAYRALSAAMIPRWSSTRAGSRPCAIPRLCEWSVSTWYA